MDFSNPLGITYRVVKELTHQDQLARLVSGSAVFDTTPDDLWDAVTNPERIPRWFLPISGDFKVGGRYQLDGNAGGEITRCDPPEALDVSWEYGENVSWVRLQLAAHAEGTQLTLEHIMLQDEASEEHWRKFGPGATGVGWDLSFVGLQLHTQTRETVPQDESHAWMASEPGKTFIRQSAAAWGDSHVESGEDKAIAHTMAESTAKFYCGE